MRPYVSKSIRQLRRLLRDMPVAMLTTQTSNGEMHSRPMLMHGVDERGWMWFVTDRRSRKATELIQNPQVSVVFQSRRGDRFVSVYGTAVVVQDDVMIKRLRNPTFRAWFPKGKQDPELVLLALCVSHAEYWLAPRSRVTRVVGAARAMLTGKRHSAGHHGELSVGSFQ